MRVRTLHVLARPTLPPLVPERYAHVWELYSMTPEERAHWIGVLDASWGVTEVLRRARMRQLPLLIVRPVSTAPGGRDRRNP